MRTGVLLDPKKKGHEKLQFSLKSNNFYFLNNPAGYGISRVFVIDPIANHLNHSYPDEFLFPCPLRPR